MWSAIKSKFRVRIFVLILVHIFLIVTTATAALTNSSNSNNSIFSESSTSASRHRSGTELGLVVTETPVIYKCDVNKSDPGVSNSSHGGRGRGEGQEFNYFEVPNYLVRESWNKSKIRFRLEPKDIYCPNGRFQLLLPSSEFESYYFYNSSSTELGPESQLIYFSSDGYLTIDTNHYHPNEYCLTEGKSPNSESESDPKNTKASLNETLSNLIITVCNPNCTVRTPCLSKCCDLNECWSEEVGGCIVVPELEDATQHLWNPEFYEPTEFDCLDNFTIEFIHFMKNVPNCSEGETPLTYYGSGQSFRILGNGTVTGRIPPADWKPLKHEGFCIDKTISRGFDGSLRFEQILLACPGQLNTMRVKSSIAPIYLAILFSAAFLLLLTSLIYLVLWRTQNLHGWCIFCEVISMFLMIMFVCVAHSLARNPDNGDYGSLHCVVIGAAAHFFFLSTFCWLTVINADLWWNFRKLSPVHKSSKNHSYRRFLLYLFASEIIPATIIAIGLLLDEKYGLKNGGLDCSELTVPNYGQTNCYLSKPAQGPYLFYPIGLLLGCNLVFFSLTIFSMLEYQKGTQEILRGKSTNQTQSFTVVAKLFIVMGVSWIFEIVAWALNQSKSSNAGLYVPSYWIVFDFVSLVQAFAIFIIFICRQTVLTQLMNKFPGLQKLWNLFPASVRARRPSAYQPTTNNVGTGNTAGGGRRSTLNMTSSPSDDVRLARMHSKTSSTLSTSIST